MIFRRLIVRAFNRFREPFEIPFDLGGIVFVEGVNFDGRGTASSNGSGKSLAIVEAPLWCLFGKMARYGDRAVGDQAAHPLNGADVSVVLERNGVEIEIHRGRTSKGKASFSASASVSKDVQRRLDEVGDLLGLDYRAFRAAVIVSGGESLASASFAEQMTVLESVLRVDELSEAAKRASEEASILEGQRAVAAVGLQGKKASLATAEEALGSLRDSAARDALLQQAQRYRDAILVAEAANGKLPELQAEVTRRHQALEEAAKASHKIKSEQGAITGRQAAASLRTTARTACPTCQRAFDNAEEIARAVEAAKEELRQLGQDFEALGLRGAEIERKARAADLQLIEARRQLQEASSLAHTASPNRLSLRQIEQALAAHEASIVAAEGRVETLKKEVDAAEIEVLDLQHAYARKKFWALHFGRDRLQAMLFQSAAPVLNEAAARYAQALTGGEILVSFNTIRGSRTEDVIRIEGGSAPTYEGLSAGEKERVNLIVALSIRALARWRLPEPINVTVYDETFDRIDEAGLEVVAKLLQEEAQTSTIFVVSHNPALKLLFPGSRVVRVTRKNREATVEVR